MRLPSFKDCSVLEPCHARRQSPRHNCLSFGVKTIAHQATTPLFPSFLHNSALGELLTNLFYLRYQEHIESLNQILQSRFEQHSSCTGHILCASRALLQPHKFRIHRHLPRRRNLDASSAKQVSVSDFFKWDASSTRVGSLTSPQLVSLMHHR